MTEPTHSVTYAIVARGQGFGPDPNALLKDVGYEGDYRRADHRITFRRPQSVVLDGKEVGPVEDLEVVTLEVLA